MEPLLEVNSQVLVDRYNECLQKLSIEPTQLTQFTIDKMGWSPEIAEEKNDPAYLHHGEANMYGIILSYEQSRVPLYRSVYSFTNYLLNRCFTKLEREIKDLSTLSGILLDFENGMSRFTDATDLLLMNHVQLKFATPTGYIQISQQQKEMHTRLKSEEYAWMDENLHQEIIDSSSRFGDLRKKALELEAYTYRHLDNFYTELFGGCFVFKTFGKKPVLILCCQAQYDLLSDIEGIKVFLLSDPETWSYLVNKEIIVINDYSSDDIPELKLLQQMIFAESIIQVYPEFDFSTLDDLETKRLLHNDQVKMPDLYFELERYIAQVNSDNAQIDAMSDELKVLLSQSQFYDCKTLISLIPLLLTHYQPYNIHTLYLMNRKGYREKLAKLTDSYSHWLHNLILEFLEE